MPTAAARSSGTLDGGRGPFFTVRT
jgi:hypothetical protein